MTGIGLGGLLRCYVKKLEDNKLIVTIAQCARCNQNHIDLEFKKFIKNPIDDFFYWSICPKLKEPILLKKVIADEKTN